MYRVIKYFTDMKDKERPYHPGDTYPREGFEVSEERLAELASNKNRRGEALIELVKEEVKEVKKPAAKKPVAKKK